MGAVGENFNAGDGRIIRREDMSADAKSGCATDAHDGGGTGGASLHVAYGALDCVFACSCECVRGDGFVVDAVVVVSEIPCVSEGVAVRVGRGRGEGNIFRGSRIGGTRSNGQGRRKVPGEGTMVDDDIERFGKGIAFANRRDVQIEIGITECAANGERIVTGCVLEHYIKQTAVPIIIASPEHLRAVSAGFATSSGSVLEPVIF